MGKKCELVLVRHGETQSNKDHTIQGHLDTPLSECGLAQARRVAGYLAPLHFHHAISSDLQRAKRTGELICDENPSLSGLELWRVARERSFGDFEGKSVDNMMNAIKGLNRSELINWGPPNGETGKDFRRRVEEFLAQLGKRILSLEEGQPRVLVTSHGGFIRDFNMLLVSQYGCEMPCKNGEYGRISPNTGVSKYEIEIGEEGVVEGVKCTQLYYKGHLEGLELEEAILYGV